MEFSGKNIFRPFFVLLLFSALIASPAAAAKKTKPSKTKAAAAEDCARCHKTILGRKFTHGPVGVGMCSVCHAKEQPGEKHHTFTLSQEQPDLCLSCHETLRKKVENSKVPHPAIASGGCTACHDPHGSRDRFFLKNVVLDKVCSACHEPKASGAVVHAPVGESCVNCHEPHGSENVKLLKASPPQLCLDCHQSPEFSGKVVHSALKKGCTSCHSPHSAAKKFLLADNVLTLCLKCHSTIAKQLKKDKLIHPAIAKAGCTGCHSPHTSDQQKLLKLPMKDLCAGCHKGKAWEFKSEYLHMPFSEGACESCHNPHSSNNANLLNAYFPKEFYNPYKDGLYALCFNCHDKDIAKDAKTTTMTEFRNGDQNLHYAHVHSQKGRSCKACHQVHASNQEKLLRAGVPFGSWMLPITFKKTPDGGTCNVGCHTPKSYSRKKALKNP